MTLTNSKKERIKLESELQKCEIHDYCTENNFTFEFINDYQIRIEGKLDIFPRSKKFFYIPRNQWGMYNKIEEPIQKYLYENRK